MFLIMNTIAQFFLVIPNTVVWAFIADVVEYGQWKFRLRSEGITYSSYSFTRKVSQALAGFVPGLALTFIGYQPNVDQSAGTIFGLKVLFLQYRQWHVPSHSLSSLYGTHLQINDINKLLKNLH